MKMTSVVKSTLAGFISVLADKNIDDASFVVKELDVLHGDVPYLRTTISFPFPFRDRDLITYATCTQDPKTKTVTIINSAVPDAYPEQEDYVRIPVFVSKWILTPIGNGELQADYYLRSDPGGSIPNWVTNMLLTISPFQAYKGIINQLSDPAFQEKTVAGIVEKDNGRN